MNRRREGQLFMCTLIWVIADRDVPQATLDQWWPVYFVFIVTALVHRVPDSDNFRWDLSRPLGVPLPNIDFP
ncbi:hypothetical protein BDR03DRAFT_954358 [Suillus americanus]|nr:hypothetical protein BDR03DRAFT_954358 [Suillus americanus]